jgi:periplasmic protein TonB
MTTALTMDGMPRAEAVRWGVSLAIVLLAHGASALAFLDWSTPSDFDAGAPVVMLELPEAPATPATPPNDVMPGPPEAESEPTPPPEEETKPPEVEAEVALPVPEPPKPEPPQEQHVATATPSVEAPPSQPSPPTPGAEVNTLRKDMIRWESTLAAHLERFKRYPADARARHETGIARVAFTIDREGHVLAMRVVQSSGWTSLDQEALAMLTRAQPMPRPPERLAARQLSFVVPVRFTIR